MQSSSVLAQVRSGRAFAYRIARQALDPSAALVCCNNDDSMMWVWDALVPVPPFNDNVCWTYARVPPAPSVLAVLNTTTPIHDCVVASISRDIPLMLAAELCRRVHPVPVCLQSQDRDTDKHLTAAGINFLWAAPDEDDDHIPQPIILPALQDMLHAATSAPIASPVFCAKYGLQVSHALDLNAQFVAANKPAGLAAMFGCVRRASAWENVYFIDPVDDHADDFVRTFAHAVKLAGVTSAVIDESACRSVVWHATALPENECVFMLVQLLSVSQHAAGPGHRVSRTGRAACRGILTPVPR